jgi:hypothetical protein
VSNFHFKPDDISAQVWMGVGGVMLVLLRSIIDGTRRTALQLLVGCIFGGLGAMAAGFVWGQSHYVYLICGVAAVITENVVIGVFNMSQQFAQNPKDIIAWFIQTVLPSLGCSRRSALVLRQLHLLRSCSANDARRPRPLVRSCNPGSLKANALHSHHLGLRLLPEPEDRDLAGISA